MKLLACSVIANQVKKGEVYLLLIGTGCAYCEQVVDELSSYSLSKPVIVSNADTCAAELQGLVEIEAYPTIVHFKDGQEVRRAVGVDDIRDFDSKPKQEPQQEAATAADSDEAKETEHVGSSPEQDRPVPPGDGSAGR